MYACEIAKCLQSPVYMIRQGDVRNLFVWLTNLFSTYLTFYKPGIKLDDDHEQIKSISGHTSTLSRHL